MDPTCGLADKIRDVMLNLIWEQLLYLLYYGKNIEQLNQQLVELTLKRISTQHQIDEARNNVKRIEEEVLHWLHEVDEISKQVDELHRESQAKRQCSITSCPNPWLRYKLSKRAKEMEQKVVEIYRKGKFDRVSYHVPPMPMPELTSRESNEGIDSRVRNMNQIIELLRNPSINMIGLCGLGGVGKTTIASEVEKKAKNQNIFEKVIMVTVSDELNIVKIQSQIADKLGMQLSENDKDARACRLYDRLKQEKNMLLILDDLWKELNLVKVGIPFVDVEKFGKKNENCKILLTSRNKTLLSDLMRCQEIVEVGVLLENEALELFKRIAELSNDSSSPELISIAAEIVQKCGGLPLAIATAAKALRNKDLCEWNDAIVRLNRLRRNTTGIKEVDTVLKLSYDHLDSEYKHIFLLAAMLSHDPSIPDLVMYSVGLDILQHAENMEEAHNGISTIVSKLKSLNLFLDSFSSHHFTMHDVFRDVALVIASNEFPAFIRRGLKEWPDKDMLQGCKGICLQESGISDLPEEFHGPLLEFFILNSTQDDLTIPSMFFKSSKELKLLAFTNVHFLSLSPLVFLRKLKALCLHSCLLEDISEIRSLKNLKALSFANSKIHRLPIELAELTCLQMLNLSHCSDLKVIPQKVLSSLKKLEVLYMRNSFDRWRVEGSNNEANKNASLEELMDLPLFSLDIQIPNVSMLPDNLFLDMNLKRCKIFIGKAWGWQDSYETSKILKVELYSNIHFKGGFQKLTEGVEDLCLYGSNAREIVLHSHDGRAFPHLRHLKIANDYGVGSEVFNSAHQEPPPNKVSNKIVNSLLNKVLLPKLETLELTNSMNRLIPLIWDDHPSNNSFSNLRTMRVISCSFVKLVPLHVLQSLNKLEELEVQGCMELEKVFDFEDLNDYKEMESSSVVVPLKKLRLWNLPKLKDVWSNHRQGNVSFPSLKSVDVRSCGSLRSIFPASIAKGMLRYLEELEISSCEYIDVIVADDQVLESGIASFEFLELTFLQLHGLPHLMNFYPQKHALEWPHLQHLYIAGCDELEMFEKTDSSSSEIYEEESTPISKYPLLSHKVIHNLEELTLSGKPAEMIASGQFHMCHFSKVKKLRLSINNENAATIVYRALFKSFPNLEVLELTGYFEEAYGGDDAAPLASPFPKITLILWSGLTSFSVSSSHLTHLEVIRCHELTTLMTSSTAQSLVNLAHLSVVSCFGMEEIITTQEGEDDENKEIIFIKLKFLKLDYLPRLKGFCARNYTFKFLLLDQLIIKECPKFKIFSPGLIETPCLKSVQMWHDWETHFEIWDTNLNKTFYHQRFVASREVVLDDEDDARMVRNSQFPADCCPKVEILHIKGYVEESVTFLCTLLERFPKLNELHVENCSFEEIIPSQAPSSTSFHNLEGGIAFNALRILKLSRLPRLKTKDNQKDFRSLFSQKKALIIKLREIKMFWHLFDEEENVLFPKLEILELSNLLNNLISSIWDEQLSHNSFSNLKTLIVKSCKFIKSVPLSVLKSLCNLEKMEVSNCDKMEIVFGFEDLNDYHKETESSSLIVPLKLTHLEVRMCPMLSTLMTSLAASSLLHVTHLSIIECNQIEEVIMKHQGEDDQDKEIFFNNMKFLELKDLPKLKRFSGCNYTFRFLLLEHVTIKECPRLTMFCPGAIHAPRLQSVRVMSKYEDDDKDIWMTNLNNTVQHLFTFEEVISTIGIMALNEKNIRMIMDVFPKVTTLYVESFKDEGVTFPYSSLKSFPKLDKLYVEHCSFEKIFPSKDEIIDFMGKIPPFEKLYIAYLDKLKSIWKDDSQLPPIHQDLLQLEVKSCCSLLKLAPSSASFQNLEKLSISGCHELIHLVTVSIAKSLVSLCWLETNDCKRMEEIVTNETNEDVEAGITFNELWKIQISDMPSLKMFSSQSHTFKFPKLKEIKITGCSKMQKFSPGVLETPKLSKVKIGEHDVEWKDKGDLNKTIEMFSSSKDSINI